MPLPSCMPPPKHHSEITNCGKQAAFMSVVANNAGCINARSMELGLLSCRCHVGCHHPGPTHITNYNRQYSRTAWFDCNWCRVWWSGAGLVLCTAAQALPRQQQLHYKRQLKYCCCRHIGELCIR
jgi:hypothetical protein